MPVVSKTDLNKPVIWTVGFDEIKDEKVAILKSGVQSFDDMKLHPFAIGTRHYGSPRLLENGIRPSNVT